MPPRDLPIRIHDILTATKTIQQHLSGFTKEAFKADKKTVQAVLYNFAVIGEAAARVPQSDRKKYPALPWKEMVGMRNIVIHEYFGVSLDILWETIQNDLPGILPQLENMASLLAERERASPKKRARPKPRK